MVLLVLSAVGAQVAAWTALVVGLAVTRWYTFFSLSDTELYARYAGQMMFGVRPYVDFTVEYPPLALPLFSLPGWLAGSTGPLWTYQVFFALEMVALTVLAACATVLAAARRGKREAYLVGLLFAASVPALGAIIANRFDPAVMLVIVVSVLLSVRGRPNAAAFALGLGFALKLMPLVLLPLVLVLLPDLRAAIKACLWCFAGAALPFVPHLLHGAAPGLLAVVRYHLVRPLEVEGTFASVLLVAQLVGIAQENLFAAFGSVCVSGPGAPFMTVLSAVSTFLAVAFTYWVLWRRRRYLVAVPRQVPFAALTVLLALMVFGKVLSPQYVVWLLPFFALTAQERKTAGVLLFAAFIATHVLFPSEFVELEMLEPQAVLLLAGRNALLVAAFFVCLAGLRRLPLVPPSSAADPPGARHPDKT